jgi:hypothetical protein
VGQVTQRDSQPLAYASAVLGQRHRAQGFGVIIITKKGAKEASCTEVRGLPCNAKWYPDAIAKHPENAYIHRFFFACLPFPHIHRIPYYYARHGRKGYTNDV